MILVHVSFKSWTNADPDAMFARIRKTAGKPSSSCGFCIPTGEFDFDFTFREKTRAVNCVRRMTRIKGAKVSIVNY